MRVHPDNLRALRCYRRADFLPVDDQLAAEWNAAQPARTATTARTSAVIR